ncbi:uncharacterized protein LOC131949581 [Physella acuta]|uniref:uncharacterized protein LOC131949581 n=1 Tax=Physella acuta TaxID=109671 RepID=UPI0027DE911D|nr:uncharacterized protein LOC131949581 [Physella acuta]
MNEPREVSAGCRHGCSVITYTIPDDLMSSEYKYDLTIQDVDNKHQRVVFSILKGEAVVARHESLPFPTKAFKKDDTKKDGKYFVVRLKKKKNDELADFFPQPST